MEKPTDLTAQKFKHLSSETYYKQILFLKKGTEREACLCLCVFVCVYLRALTNQCRITTNHKKKIQAGVIIRNVKKYICHTYTDFIAALLEISKTGNKCQPVDAWLNQLQYSHTKG